MNNEMQKKVVQDSVFAGVPGPACNWTLENQQGSQTGLSWNGICSAHQPQEPTPEVPFPPNPNQYMTPGTYDLQLYLDGEANPAVTRSITVGGGMSCPEGEVCASPEPTAEPCPSGQACPSGSPDSSPSPCPSGEICPSASPSVTPTPVPTPTPTVCPAGHTVCPSPNPSRTPKPPAVFPSASPNGFCAFQEQVEITLDIAESLDVFSGSALEDALLYNRIQTKESDNFSIQNNSSTSKRSAQEKLQAFYWDTQDDLSYVHQKNQALDDRCGYQPDAGHD